MTDTNPITAALDRRRYERQGRYQALTGTTPEPVDPEVEWMHTVIETLKGPAVRQAEAEAAEAEERSQAEAQPLPLNGAQLLRNALGGQPGTVNGASVDSTAELIRRALAGGVNARMDATG